MSDVSDLQMVLSAVKGAREWNNRRGDHLIPFESVNIESAPKQISRQIREAILDGTLKPEQRLPTEEELATSFNVSRASIREALKRLAVENLVVVRRGAQGGNFVRAPSRDRKSHV